MRAGREVPKCFTLLVEDHGVRVFAAGSAGEREQCAADPGLKVSQPPHPVVSDFRSVE